jgi:hypothetical protein
MSVQFPGVTIHFEFDGYSASFTDTNGIVRTSGGLNQITNYEYEVKLNEEKRKILILKQQYLSVFINDMKNIMTYDQSSDYIDANTKATHNPKLTGN